MRRPLGISLGIAAVVACGTQIDLTAVPAGAFDGGPEAGPGSSSGSSGARPENDGESPPAQCQSELVRELFIRDAGPGVDGSNWIPSDSNWTTQSSAHTVDPAHVEVGGTTSQILRFDAPSTAQPLYLERELQTTCATLQVIAEYVTSNLMPKEFDLFTVVLNDGTALSLHFANGNFVGTRGPATTPSAARTIGGVLVQDLEITAPHRVRAVFSTNGGLVADVDDAGATTLLPPSQTGQSRFEAFRLGPDVTTDASTGSLSVGLLTLESLEPQ